MQGWRQMTAAAVAMFLTLASARAVGETRSEPTREELARNNKLSASS